MRARKESRYDESPGRSTGVGFWRRVGGGGGAPGCFFGATSLPMHFSVKTKIEIKKEEEKKEKSETNFREGEMRLLRLWCRARHVPREGKHCSIMVHRSTRLLLACSERERAA